MASTREERLQMRQRGAGTRKIQQVDFGFSFGGQQGGLGDPAPPSLFPEPAKPPQEPPTPTATTPKASQSTSQTTSQSQRTPGSARNNVPQRASAYDIPSDDAPQEPRSSKRRRINPINESSGSPSSRKERQSGDGNVKPANGDALPSKELETNDTTLPDAPPQEPTVKAPKPSDVPEVPGDIEMKEAGNVEPDDQNDRAEATRQPSTTQPEGQDGTQMEKSVETPQEPQPSDAQPQETQSPVESTKPASKKQRKSRSPPQAEDPPSKGTEKDAAAAKEIQASAQLPKENKKTQRSREPSVNGGASPGQGTEKPRREDGTRSKARDSQASVSRGKRSGSRPLSSGKKNHEVQARSDPEPEQPQIPEPEADQASNPRRGRPARNDKKLAEPESSTTTERPEPAVDTQLDKDAVPPKSRGRPAKKDDKSAEPEPTTEPEAAEAQLEKDAGPSKSRGRPAKKDKKPAEPESNTRTEQPKEDSAPPKASRGRPGRKYKTSDSAEQPEAQPDPQPDPAAESSKSHRAKDGKRKKRTREPEAEAPPPEEQPASESAPQPEPEQPEEEQDPGESRPQQKGSNKRGRKSKKTATSETTTPEEPTPTEEAADSQPARERRKPREPRGETVPVTVHRLANSSALGMMYTSGVSEDENEDSADELSTRQKTKLPKRGGVNPADVLGQICRETLEKTLTALKNGIENESNTQRRAEWTRKRKAVEAFGSELDGRLLDLSEMLDSNFVLGVQLKKEKRDMIDLRTHLYKVRKEREAIALQMDAVRAKHMEEEAAKTSRTTINNSLHSLELALDRTQHRDPPSADPSSAELEFLLRTVADDVSCRAPGSQGGLLEQIRTFNAQLESTARRLEGQ